MSDMPRQPSHPALRADSVSFSIAGDDLLRNVSLDINGGELVAVVGPNGAGKTTLLRLLAGDAVPSSGELYLDERPIGDYSPRELARRRAVMPQSSYLPFLFTAREVVRMGRAPWEGERGEREHGAELADRVMGLTDTREYAPRAYPTLSGGEQSRVTLARVLAQETPILVVDEPTAHLDPRHQHLVLDLLHELASEGAAIIAVLHDLNLAAAYADRVALLHRGELVCCAHPDEALDPAVLKPVFGLDFVSQRHPDADRPVLIPLPRHLGARRQD